MNTQQTGFLLLIKSAILGIKCTLPNEFDLENVVKIARKHQLSAMSYYGAVNCGISQNLPIMQQLFLDTCGFISLNESQLYEINKIICKFEENKIDYMPLKGVLLKKLYPKSEMRAMSDADILIKTEQYDKIKPIMFELGYSEVVESNHELIWKKNGINIELHKRLIPSYNKDYYEYFGDGWRLGNPSSDNTTCYKMSAEDEMIYLFTHYAKHYRDAGIGIKHIVDLWVYRNSVEVFDEEYTLEELKKLQLDDFYKNTMRTLDVWFEDAEPDDITEWITHTIFNSGVFGTHEARILSKAVKDTKFKGSAKKARYNKIITSIFLPYDEMCKRYKVLKRFTILLPFMWIVRLFDILLFKNYRIKRNGQDLKIMTVDRINNYQDSLKFVGLDFNFKE